MSYLAAALGTGNPRVGRTGQQVGEHHVRGHSQANSEFSPGIYRSGVGVPALVVIIPGYDVVN